MSKNSASSTLDASFRQLWQSFAATYGSLRVFAEEITRRADQVDEKRLRDMVEDMVFAFNDDPATLQAELREFLPSLEHDHLYPDFSTNPNYREVVAAFQDSAFKRRILRWAVEEPERAYRFLNVFADALYQPPVNGIYLRQSVLLALVSAVEVFVDELLFVYGMYVDSQYQAISDSTEKEKQVRDAYDLRTWKKRWEKLIELVPGGKWQAWQNEWSEIVARRNALIHNGGRADEQYLKQAPHAFQPEGAKAGRTLLVPTAYLNRSVEVALLFTFSLSQNAWRKWQRHRKAADEAVNALIYENLRQRRYPIVVELAQMAIDLHMDWRREQYVWVNWAIALREQGKIDEMITALVSLERRKKRLWQIEIALNVLHRRDETVRCLLQEAAQKGKLHKEISLSWPLFDPVWEETWFKNLFNVSHGALPRAKKKR